MSCPRSTRPSPRPARRCPSYVARSRRSRWLNRRLVQRAQLLRRARWPGEGWTEIVTPLRRGPSPRTTTLRGYDLTLIEAEVLDHLTLPGGGKIDYLEARRNVITSGIDLNALVGRRFRVGDAECLGQRLCEPCSHLERLTAKGVLRELIHRGGLRADVLTDGQISNGAVIETID